MTNDYSKLAAYFLTDASLTTDRSAPLAARSLPHSKQNKYTTIQVVVQC